MKHENMVLKIDIRIALSLGIGLICLGTLNAQKNSTENTMLKNKTADQLKITPFVQFINAKNTQQKKALLKTIDKHWEATDEILLLETIYFTLQDDFSEHLVRLLEKKTTKNYGYDFDQWFSYIWQKENTYTDAYFMFKAQIHQHIDSKFFRYFNGRARQSNIRLDEVRWGGVVQDGIPPLRNPKMITAKQAAYIRGSDIVFGIEVNGDARAYPKKILAWHELFVDTVGDLPVAGVYCTLCGTVIVYKTEHNGVAHELGTSGFLYRSNKLMYDKKTQSLWSTLEGTPVIGPLTDQDIQLEYLSVVTTTWEAWKNRHPETSVLSLQTGHRRDYREGVAYKEYFATDALMFGVPSLDTRLKNKDAILAIRSPKDTEENIAISSEFLKKNRIYTSTLGTIPFTVFTDASGAHRVYRTKAIQFTTYDGYNTATSSDGKTWQLTESTLQTQLGDTLKRLPTHNAFWFGYKAAYPNTTLIK